MSRIEGAVLRLPNQTQNSVLDYYLDLKNILPAGVVPNSFTTATSVTKIVGSLTPQALTVSQPSVSGTQLVFVISGGTDLTDYKIDIICALTSDFVYECSVFQFITPVGLEGVVPAVEPGAVGAQGIQGSTGPIGPVGPTGPAGDIIIDSLDLGEF